MKRVVSILMLVLVVMVAVGQSTNELYKSYIEQYYKAAQEQQKKHGIPASITLAQGLLESGAGKSELATKANNHFGIKCAGGWTGKTYTHDDETKNECFRSYSKASESYEDHSLFLLRPRYQSLFDLKVTDYKGWAKGLKQCGYATDPQYPNKLIKIIEDYGLAKYDTEAKSSKKSSKTETATSKRNATQATATTSSSSLINSAIGELAYAIVDGVSALKNNTERTDPNDEGETVEYAANNALGEVAVGEEHEVVRNNGRKMVVARAGDTFASIGFEFNIYESRLRKYNDVVNPRYQLHEGDKVYLRPKRSKAQRQYQRYFVRSGENIWQIAQDKGMKLNTIYKLNGIEKGQNVTVNQELRLR